MPIYSNENSLFLSTYHSSSWFITSKRDRIFSINPKNIELFSLFIFAGNIISVVLFLLLIRIIPCNFSILDDKNILVGMIPIAFLISTVIFFTSAPKFYHNDGHRLTITKRTVSIAFEFFKCISALCMLTSTSSLLLDNKNNYSDIITILIGLIIFSFVFVHWIMHLIAVLNINSKLFEH